MAGPYVWIAFPETDRGYEAIRYDFRPRTEGGFHFWAFQYALAGSPSGGYFGMQTRGGMALGKCVIFSQWNTSGGGHGDPERFSRTISQSFAGEGEGWQTLAHFPWETNREYQFELRFANPTMMEASVNGWRYGTIHVPADYGPFSPSGHVVWTERYGDDGTDADARGEWRDLKALERQGRRLRARGVDAYLPIVGGSDTPPPASITMRRRGFDEYVGP